MTINRRAFLAASLATLAICQPLQAVPDYLPAPIKVTIWYNWPREFRFRILYADRLDALSLPYIRDSVPAAVGDTLTLVWRPPVDKAPKQQATFGPLNARAVANWAEGRR
jgi:hypothetical protein